MDSSQPTHSELIEIIKSNNMVEDFVKWLREIKKIDLDPISLKDIDYELLLEFLILKGILRVDTSEEFTISDNDQLELYTTEAVRHTKPKKIRRKT